MRFGEKTESDKFGKELKKLDQEKWLAIHKMKNKSKSLGVHCAFENHKH